MENDIRLRLKRTSDVLRKFHITDRFGLSELMQSEALPSFKKLTSQIEANDEFLPPGVTAEYIARCLLMALEVAPPELVSWQQTYPGLASNLHDIKTGNASFKKYEDHVFELLQAIFAGYLDKGTKQERMDQGRKIVDIVFENCSENGFFAFLRDRKRILCDYVFFECKNYADDPGNPEFDQLSGRLDDRRGKVGFLVARRFKNRANAFQHCKDKLSKGEYLFLLDDADIENLFAARARWDLMALNAILQDQFRAHILNK